MVKILKEGDPIHARYAAWALGRIGPGDRSLVPPLVAAMDHKNLNVRLNALMSLEFIAPDAKTKNPAVAKVYDSFKSDGSLDSTLVFCAAQIHSCPAILDRQDAEVLIGLGANVDHKDPLTGKTGLIVAIDYGDVDLVGLLIKKGSDVNAINDVAWSPPKDGNRLPVAVFTSILLKLRGLSAIPEEKPVLFHAIEADIPDEKKLKILRLLVESGANVAVTDSNSRTPLGLIKSLNLKEIAEFLATHGPAKNN
jgi:ankyrin repeat protein